MKKVLKIRNSALKCNLWLYFLIYQTFLWKNPDISRNQGLCHVMYIFFGLLYLRYIFAKFHHCRIYVKNSRGGLGLSAPSLISRQSRKCPSWMGLIMKLQETSPRCFADLFVSRLIYNIFLLNCYILFFFQFFFLTFWVLFIFFT